MGWLRRLLGGHAEDENAGDALAKMPVEQSAVTDAPVIIDSRSEEEQQLAKDAYEGKALCDVFPNNTLIQDKFLGPSIEKRIGTLMHYCRIDGVCEGCWDGAPIRPIREIGEQFHSDGGMALMLFVYYRVEASLGAVASSTMSKSWDGVGEWSA